MVGDFNAEDFEETMFNFLQRHNAANIVKDEIYFNSLTNPSCIDLFITNRPHYFQNTTVFPTGLSYFHKMAVTVLKTSFGKAPRKEMFYRDYKNFEQDKSGAQLGRRGEKSCPVLEKIPDCVHL